MKGLSIKEKAKAYDEAIDKAKKELDACGSQDCDAARQIFRLFSELNVSEDEDEDEKIRKSIIAIINNYVDNSNTFKPKMIAWLEKQGQTFTKEDTDNANKVEPKFKAGNWYQCTKDFFGKGVTFDKNTAYYCAQEGCLQNEYGCHIAIVKDLYDNFKLWTIQDARDGDVLCCESGWTCIFKTLINYETFSSYCFMDETKWFCETGSECHTLKEEFIKAYNGKIYPATKEQRNNFFVKMKEAGYEWDAEKKELKKISQRIISAEAKEAMYGKPTAWSEDDEAGLGDAMWAIEQARTIAKDENDMGNLWYAEHWLKSLKDRVGFETDCTTMWKPSEKQMEALKEACDEHWEPDGLDPLYTLYQELKKLREE